VQNFLRIIGVATAGCLLSSPGVARADGEKITTVVVKGNRRIEASAIMNVISIKAGDKLDSDKADADLKAIFKLGQFSDVQIITEPAADNGIVLVYAVQEKPIIREIRFEGNKEIKQDKLQESLLLRRNAIFSQAALTKSVAKIKKQYQDEGYYLVEVTAAVDKKSATDYLITFTVVEGEKIRISDIRFEGNNAFSARKLRGVMETKEEWFMSWLTGAGNYKEEVLKNDALLIADHYMNNGYINIKVGEPAVKMAENHKNLEVVIPVTEGEQYKVSAVVFKGELLDEETVLKKKLKLESGEIFSRALLRADITELTDHYADKGYAFANINPSTKTDPEKKELEVTFEVEKGELVYIEKINIVGNPKTRDKVLRRELRLAEGELYSATGLKRSKQNLMNTGYLEEANISTPKGSAANKLNMNVEVKEKPTGAFTIGGGYSSLDGMVFQGSVSQANFMGLGLKANASASIGGKSNTYSVGLTDPYFLDSKWTLGADIYRSEREYNDYSQRRTGGDIKAGYPITDFIGTFWMYKYEVKDIYDPSAAYLAYNAINAALYPINQTTTSALYSSITHNNTDFRFDPSTGMLNTLSVEYAGLGGDNKYVREIMENTFYYPFWWKFVLSAKVVVGAVQKAGGPIPIDEKFYLGGLGTLRGYEARTVSPSKLVSYPVLDVNGAPVLDSGGNPTYSTGRIYTGGEKEIFGNLELKFPLLQEFGVKGVFFFDYGNAWDSGVVPSKLQMSYGGGIRWASPMGPLRLEYGIPINPRPGIDDKSGRFEFGIGSMF
jgi:outer membrane protein insertion porin family